jgi:hypothetical protein
MFAEGRLMLVLMLFLWLPIQKKKFLRWWPFPQDNVYSEEEEEVQRNPSVGRTEWGRNWREWDAKPLWATKINTPKTGQIGLFLHFPHNFTILLSLKPYDCLCRWVWFCGFGGSEKVRIVLLLDYLQHFSAFRCNQVCAKALSTFVYHSSDLTSDRSKYMITIYQKQMLWSRWSCLSVKLGCTCLMVRLYLTWVGRANMRAFFLFSSLLHVPFLIALQL